MRVRFEIMRDGDEIINITAQFIAVKHEDGTAEIFPIKNDEGHLRIDKENIITIGYGTNTVKYEEDGYEVTNF